MKLNSLTSLRFFAAFAVCFEHFFQNIVGSEDSLVNTIRSFAYEGSMWVAFFFVLSGFIISYSYGDRILKGTTGFFEFIYYRLARLYPVHVLTLLVFAWHFLGGYQWVDGGRFLINLAMIQSWFSDQNIFWGFNAVSWSISCEMFFYASFVFLVTFTNRQLLGIFAVLLVLAFTHKYVYRIHGPYELWSFYISPAFRLIDFIAGMLVYRAFVRFKDLSASPAQVFTILEVCSIVVLLALIYYGVTNGVDSSLRHSLYYLPAIMAMIFIFAFCKGAVSNALSCRPLIYLGESSYSLYMCHFMLVGYMANVARPYVDVNSIGSVMLNFAAVSVVVIVVSGLVYSFYEKPANNLLRKLWRRPKQKGVEMAS